MPFRRLAPLLWIVVYLVALEVALELRATGLGWPTLLFGGAAGERAADEQWGPDDDFPFRSPKIEAASAPARPRVWFASSSYGEDVQQPPERVFPNLVAQGLRERGLECDALNASWAGATLEANTLDLERSGAQFGPRVVVLYQMSNDIDEIATSLCGRGWRPSAERASDEAPAAGPIEYEDDWLARTVEETTTYKHLKSAVTSRVTTQRRLARTLGEGGEQRFEHRLRAFVAKCRELGAEPVLCTFATATRSDSLDATPPEYVLNLLRFNVVLSLEGWIDSVERWNEVLRRVAREEQLALVELAEPLGGRAELFRDMWHFTAEGHAEAARRIAERLAVLPALKREPPR